MLEGGGGEMGCLEKGIIEGKRKEVREKKRKRRGKEWRLPGAELSSDIVMSCQSEKNKKQKKSNTKQKKKKKRNNSKKKKSQKEKLGTPLESQRKRRQAKEEKQEGWFEKERKKKKKNFAQIEKFCFCI